MLASALTVTTASAADAHPLAGHGAWRSAPHRAAARDRPARFAGNLAMVAQELLSDQAGARSSRIVGGAATVQGQWGFMAFVVHFDSAGNGDFVCSGTLVSSNVVLTAGHCAVDANTGKTPNPGDYRVVTGAVDWTNTTNRQISTVSQLLPAPGLDLAGPAHDAALLVLSAPVSQTPVALPEGGQLVGGTPGKIAGWGFTDGAQSAVPDVLQSAPTVIQSSAYCAQPFLSNYSFDSSSALCAVNAPSYDTGTCNGDSGGPLLTRDTTGGWVEVGVTSVGPASCDTRAPDFYTAVLPLASWISKEAQAVAPPGASGPSFGSPGSPTSPATATKGASSPTSSPSGLSPLTLPAARSYVHRTLVHVLSTRAKVPQRVETVCRPVSRSQMQCGFAFHTGAALYRGSVTVLTYLGTDSKPHWSARYKVQWLNSRCRAHNRRRCSLQHRSGSW